MTLIGNQTQKLENQQTTQSRECLETLDVSSVLKNTEKPPTSVRALQRPGVDRVQLRFSSSHDSSACRIGRRTSVAQNGSKQDIPNFGRAKIRTLDEFGNKHEIEAHIKEVHKPLESASEISKHHDAFIFDEPAFLLQGPIAEGLRRECRQLCNFCGRCGILPLYREGNVYNYSLRRVGKLEMAPVEENQDIVMNVPGNTCSTSAGNFRQAQKLQGRNGQAPMAAARVAPWNVEEKRGARSKASRNGDDDEFEEPELLRTVTVVRALTESEEENHPVYTCVAARGTGAHRRHRRRKQIDQKQRGPRIFSDCSFMSTVDGSTPMLASGFFENGTQCSDGTSEQGSDRVCGKILHKVHRDNWRQEIHELLRQRTSNVGAQRCISRSTTTRGINS